MRTNTRQIIALTLSILIFSLTSCALFIPNDRFDGGKLLDSEKMSQIKSEIFATETVETTAQSTITTETNASTEKDISTEKDASEEIGVSTDHNTNTSENKEPPETEDPEITEQTKDNITEAQTSSETVEERTEITEIQSYPETTLTTETNVVESSTETNISNYETVYWTKSGTVWHLFKDCGHLKNSKTVISGSLEEAINEGKEKVCSSCNKRRDP